MPKQWLCASADLPEGGSLRVSFEGDEHAHGLCLIRKNDQIFAYLNRCPHQKMALDWLPGQFLDASGEQIICAMHGAHFQIEDGLCVSGPCLGQSLQAVALEERDGQIVLLE